MSYTRKPYENLEKFRERIESAYSTYVGPVPTSRRVRSRTIYTTPLRELTAMAAELNRRENLSQVPISVPTTSEEIAEEIQRMEIEDTMHKYDVAIAAATGRKPKHRPLRRPEPPAAPLPSGYRPGMSERAVDVLRRQEFQHYRPPRRVNIPVTVPYIVDPRPDDRSGHVTFYVRAEDDVKVKYPKVASYRNAMSRLLSDRKYRAYVKKISVAGSGAPEDQLEYDVWFDAKGDIQRTATGNLNPNLDLTPGTRLIYPWMLREPHLVDNYHGAPTHDLYEVDYAWEHIPMVNEDDHRYESTSKQYGKAITPGRMEAFIRERIIGDTPPPYVIGWLVSLVPIGAEGIAWLAMRAGEINCVAAAIKANLAACRSLTPTREKIINEWAGVKGNGDSVMTAKAISTADDMLNEYLTGTKIARDGASFADTDQLASKLKMRLQFYDIAGTLLHEKVDASGRPVYANGRKIIALYRSDGHCSMGSPDFEMPTKIHITKGPEIKFPRAGENSAYAKQREMENIAAMDAYIVSTIREHNLERAQIIGSEIVAGDTLYRPMFLDKQLHEAAAKLKLRPPMCDWEGRYAWAERHTNSRDMPRDMPPELYFVDMKIHIGGVQSYYFKHWIKNHEFQSLWPASRDGWKQATLEAVVWTAEGMRRDSAAALYDMRAAYLACDSRDTHAAGPSHDAAKRFGFPRGGRTRKCLATTWESIQMLTGFIRYQSLKLATHTPVAIAAHVANHFRNRHSPIAIPAAVWLHEHGYIEDYSILDVEYTDRITGVKFPNDRNLSVRLIGSCSYRDTRRTFYTRDPAEKDHFMGLYGAHPKKTAEGFIINYPSNKDTSSKMKDYSHIRAYVLAYQAIAMWSAIASLGPNLIGTSADSVLVYDSVTAESVLPMQSDYVIKWGEFRPKPMPTIQPAGPVGPPTKTAWVSDQTTTATHMAPSTASLTRSITAYISPGGFGKTTRAIQEANASGRRVHILVGTNKGEIKIKNDLIELGVNLSNFTISTYHHFFRVSEDPNEIWDSAVMGKTALCQDIIIWDEFPIAGPKQLDAIIPWLKKVGLTTILCGDPLGQLQEFKDPISGEIVMSILENNMVPIESGTGVDWRARDCPALQAAKRACWCKDDITQVNVLKNLATHLTFKEAVEMWEPGDVVIEATNRDGKDIEAAIDTMQMKKHGGAGRVDVVFKPTKDLRDIWCKKKNGVLGNIKAPNGEMVPAAVGSVISITRSQAAKMDKKLWKPASRITVHSVQGETIKRQHKIFISLQNMPADWCRNAVYVAMSRAELASQLYVFTLNGTTPLPLTAAEWDDVYVDCDDY